MGTVFKRQLQSRPAFFAQRHEILVAAPNPACNLIPKLLQRGVPM
jgi:hypothetical protein